MKKSKTFEPPPTFTPAQKKTQFDGITLSD